MLRRILKLFGSLPRKEYRYIPSTRELPWLWIDCGGVRREPNLAVLDTASTQALTQLCDDYWHSYIDDDYDQPAIRDDRIHRRALELLATRGRESLSWARARLRHTGYYAREDAASLIAQIAQSQQLGSEAEGIAEELAVLALRRPEEDPKEAQAASVALWALSFIGGSPCMKAVRGVLNSPEWDDHENQEEAAGILARIAGTSFVEAEDPVAAAKAWLSANQQSSQ